MKVSLVFPRTKYVSGDPPLGLANLAAYARSRMKGLDIEILDSTFDRSLKDSMKRIKDLRPDVVGIFTDTMMYDDAVFASGVAKEAGSFVVMGGPHATVCPESLERVCDIVVRGEGEVIFSEILERFAKSGPEGVRSLYGEQKMLDSAEKRISNLDDLPLPAFDLLDMARYTSAWNYLDAFDIGLKGTTMITSRGCPYRCSYCQPTLDLLFGPRLRRSSPEKVAGEIDDIARKFSIEGIFFHDDTFTVDKIWTMEFCGSIKRKNTGLFWGCNSRLNTVDEEMLREMYSAGLRNIHFGIEAGSQRVIDEILDKRIRLTDASDILNTARKIGIHTLGFFMIGAPGETRSEIKRTIDFARRLPLDEATFSITTPLPGTFLFDKARITKSYNLSANFSDFDYYKGGAVRRGDITAAGLKYLQIKALIVFYLHPKRIKYLVRHLFSLSGIRKLVRKLRRFI
jgi:radical SAM superfamily enzyme YgiQ (UPF0313 family)